MSESERVYIIIPRTLDSDKPPYKFNMTCGRMAAHAAHAASVLTRASGIDVADKDLIVLSVGSSVDLENTKFILERENISYLEYRDTDKAFEGELLTAVITYPLTASQRRPLKHLRPWCCKCNELGSGSSEKEHSAFNGGVGGSSPSPSSIPSNPQGLSDRKVAEGANLGAVPHS